MPITSTDICNNALIRIGAKAVTSIDDDNAPNAVLCRRLYEITRDEILRSHPWSFALSRAILVQDASVPAFGFDYRYHLPSGENYCLRVIRVNDGRDNYKIEGRYLLTDISPVNLIYVKQVTVESDFDSLFIESLILKLGAKLSTSIRQEPSLTQALMGEYRLVIANAKTISAIESSYSLTDLRAKKYAKSSFINSRLTSTNG